MCINFLAFLVLHIAISVQAAGLHPSDLGPPSHTEPNTDLSLGGIFGGSGAGSQAVTSPTGASSSQAPHVEMWPSLLFENEPDLNLNLGSADQQASLAHEARMKRVEELRNDLYHHFQANWEVWPATHYTSKGRYAMYVPTVKKRALGAFLLRDKYRAILDPFLGHVLWSLERYREWHDRIPDRGPTIRLVDRTDGYQTVEENVSLIEKYLRSYEQSFKP